MYPARRRMSSFSLVPFKGPFSVNMGAQRVCSALVTDNAPCESYLELDGMSNGTTCDIVRRIPYLDMATDGPSKWGSLDLVGLSNTASTVLFHARRKWSRCGTKNSKVDLQKKIGNLSTWPKKYPFCTPQQVHFLEKNTASCQFFTHIVAAAILDAIWCSHAPHGSAFGMTLRCYVDPEVFEISKNFLAETGHVPCPEANVKFLTCAL